MKSENCPRSFDFTLVLDRFVELTREVEDKLYEAGCDDATISVRAGRVMVTFSRESTSEAAAILSAIENVNQAKVGARVLRVDVSDLITQSEIARRISRSRQLVHQFVLGRRGPGGFPPPVCEIGDGVSVWYWWEVAQWLFENSMISEETARSAQAVSVINAVLEMLHQKRIDPSLMKKVVESIGREGLGLTE